jgi:hypothetical protein
VKINAHRKKKISILITLAFMDIPLQNRVYKYIIPDFKGVLYSHHPEVSKEEIKEYSYNC